MSSLLIKVVLSSRTLVEHYNFPNPEDAEDIAGPVVVIVLAVGFLGLSARRRRFDVVIFRGSATTKSVCHFV